MGNGGMGTLMKIDGLSLSGTLMANNRKLTKSLIFIIALNLFGVFLKSSVNMLFQSFVVANVFVKTSVSIAFSFFTITVYSANAPVLYIINNEYRNRFQQNFPWLIKVKGLGSAVTSVSASLLSILIALSKIVLVLIDTYFPRFSLRNLHQCSQLVVIVCFVLLSWLVLVDHHGIGILLINVIGTVFIEFTWDACYLWLVSGLICNTNAE
ncbi:hypothetical protein niasHT_025123 [Heterodera trifolii]|uniref:Uncharacterized protein n=1 Tax=Heterodera trifolii TaxID=157864 RepID=A0ABD2K1C1_9BILA